MLNIQLNVCWDFIIIFRNLLPLLFSYTKENVFTVDNCIVYELHVALLKLNNTAYKMNYLTLD